MKTIFLEDYYAPAFNVRISDASKCSAVSRNPRVGYTPLFRTTHPEPWRPGATRLLEHRRRFTALSRA